MSDAAGPPRVTDAQATYLTVAVPPPSPEAQLAFLQKVQRILAEGDFTATYKFALLIALTELAVEKGDDTGSPLVLATRDIAEKFAELYWGQTVPYRSAGADAESVLSQVTDDRNARVVSVLSELRQRSGVSTLPAARAHPGWNGALAQLAAVVRAQPLTYLQNVGRETLPFLYTFNAPGTIRLHAGVAFNSVDSRG